MSRRTALTSTAVAVLMIPATLSALAAPASASDARSTVASDQPSYTVSAPSTPVASDLPVDFRVDLPLRDEPAAMQYLQAVSTPGSAGYRAYLSPAKFRDTYGPTQASVRAVTVFLKSHGLTVTDVRPSRTTLSVTGTASQAKAAFGATLKTYDTPDSGELVATEGQLTAPTQVAGLIAGVRGLSESQRLNTPRRDADADVPGTDNSKIRRDPGLMNRTKRKGGGAPPSPGFLGAPPCSTYYGEKLAKGTPKVDGKVQPYAPCGYVPKQVRSAYGVDTVVNGRFPIDGRGTRIAITDAYNSPTVFSDLSTYSQRNGLPALRPGQYKTVLPKKAFRFGYNDAKNGDQCGEQGWYGEQTLDVEAVHGIAPGADIVYVAARSCDNLDFGDALASIVDGQLADAISNSWGSSGEADDIATLQSYQQIFLQAAIQGIGVYFSSGDAGDNTGGDPTVAPTVDLPASNPLVTAVGGTSLAVGQDGTNLFETGWGTGKSTLTKKKWVPRPPGTFVYGGGGGASSLFDQPFYQQGVVPDALATKSGLGRKTRVLPDVSMVGDPNTGFLVGQTQTFLDEVRYDEYRIGGTSLSSPLMAGLVAIADQASGFHHGFINPALYPLVGTSYVNDPSDPSVSRYVVRQDFGSDPETGISDPSLPITTSLRSLNLTNTLRVAPGYDDVTGVGTPKGVGFLTHLGSPLAATGGSAAPVQTPAGGIRAPQVR